METPHTSNIPLKDRLPRFHLAAGLGLLALAIATIYWQTLGFSFLLWDDQLYVTGNLDVRRGLTWEGTVNAFTNVAAFNYHPVTLLSHMLDVSLFGMSAAGHHAVNVILHVCNTFLLAILLIRTTTSFWPSIAVAAVFATHPLHVESVAWIAERKDLLFTAFGFGCLLAYHRYTLARRPATYLASFALLALALLSKPMAVIIPACMLLMDYWPFGRATTFSPRLWAPLLREKIPFFVLALASAAATLWAQGSALQSLESINAAQRLIIPIIGYGAYLRQTFWPADLHYFYELPSRIPWLHLALTLATITMVTWGAIRLRGRHPAILMGWTWFLVTLVPVIGLVQVGTQAHADRYMYVPLIGLSIAVIWPIYQRHQRHALILGTTGLVILGLLTFTAWRQTAFWRDTPTLFQRALDLNPEHSHANVQMAVYHSKLGDWTKVQQHLSRARGPITLTDVAMKLKGTVMMQRGDLAGAERMYRQVISRYPGDAEAYFNIGALWHAQGDRARAMTAYETALRIRPNYPDARTNLAAALAESGQIERALLEYERVLRVTPTNGPAHFNLARLHESMGNPQAAIRHYQEAVRLRPDLAKGWFYLGRSYLSVGQRAPGIEALTRSLELMPDNPEAISLLRLHRP